MTQNYAIITIAIVALYRNYNSDCCALE